jgi:hypothetical protein
MYSKAASISQFESIAVAAQESWELKAFLSPFQVILIDKKVGNSMDELDMQ